MPSPNRFVPPGDNVEPVPTFGSLLQQLEDAHNREIGRLHDVHDCEIEKLHVEVARLRHMCSEIGSNGIAQTPKFDDPDKLERMSLIQKPRHSGERPSKEDTDELVHRSPRVVAKGRTYSIIQEEDRPDKDVLEAALRVAAYEEQSSEIQQTFGLQYKSPRFSVPSALLIATSETEEAEQSQSLMQTLQGFVSYSEPAMGANSSTLSERSVCPGTLQGWRVLIQAVKAHKAEKEAAAVAPVLNKVWSTQEKARGSHDMTPTSSHVDSNYPDMERVVQKAVCMRPPTAVDISVSGEFLLKVTKRDNCFSRLWKTSMLHPTSRKRAVWDVTAISLLLHDLVVIPLHVFENGTNGMADAYTDFLEFLDVAGASFWSVDILVSFRTGYYSEAGFVEMRPLPVAKNYIKSWLPLDLFVVAIDWCTMLLGLSSAVGFMRLGKTISRIMRVLRLLRFLKMNQTVIQFLARIHSDYLLQVMGLVKTLILILIMNHYVACAWYGLGRLGFVSNWPDVYLVNYPESLSYAYSTSLHWSLTQFTPASMEVVPENSVERFFDIAVIIVALVAFSSFVSSITTTMTYIRHMNAEKVELEAKIRQFFTEHNISKAMASRVWHYFRHNRIHKAKRMKESDIPAFEILPERIKEDMRVEVYLPTLRGHPLFAEYGKRQGFAMRRICSEALSEVSLIAGEEIWRDSKEVQEMLFIVNGSLVYHEEVGSLDPGNIGVDYAEITVGQWACELSLWAETAILPGVFMALTLGCEIVLVDAVKFRKIGTSFPGTVRFLSEYAGRFLDGYNAAFSQAFMNLDDTSPEDALFNKFDTADQMVQFCQGPRQSTTGFMGQLFSNIIGDEYSENNENATTSFSVAWALSLRSSAASKRDRASKQSSGGSRRSTRA